MKRKEEEEEEEEEEEGGGECREEVEKRVKMSSPKLNKQYTTVTSHSPTTYACSLII